MRILTCGGALLVLVGLAGCADDVQPKPAPTLNDREKIDADRTPSDRPKPTDPPTDPQTSPTPAPAPTPAPSR
jgi:hypothetical protein